MSHTDRPKNVDQFIGARLEALRKNRGLTQSELADLVEVSIDQIEKWEAGQHMGASRLFKIAAVLKTPIAQFFDGLESALGLPEVPRQVPKTVN